MPSSLSSFGPFLRDDIKRYCLQLLQQMPIGILSKTAALEWAHKLCDFLVRSVHLFIFSTYSRWLCRAACLLMRWWKMFQCIPILLFWAFSPKCAIASL